MKRQRRQSDAGFTLIELLIAIVLSGLIAGVTVAALLTSTNVARSTSDFVNDSNDAGVISAFLFRDAQSAGVTDPSTATLDPTVGVSTANNVGGWAGCGQVAPLVIRFSWIDRTQATAGSKVVVTYALDSTTGQLTRRTCSGATSTVVPVGNHVTSALATCQPVADCSSAPSAVSLAVTGGALDHPFSYTLTASLRRLDQSPPSAANSSPVPLVVFGDSSSGGKPCPNLTLGGTGVVHVLGDAVVDGSCHAPGSSVQGTASLLQPSGTLSTFSGVPDPFTGLVPPAYSCAGGANPPVGQSSGPTAIVVYPQAVTVSSATNFQPGRYVFCAGVAMSGGTITGSGVQFFVAGGALSIGAAATLDLSPITAGSSSEPLIWIAPTASALASIAAGSHVDNLRGIVYAPATTLQLSSALDLDLGGVIAREATVAGAGQVRIGMPVPVLTIAPATLPMGEVGVGYGATLVASGASAPVSWSASGLPPGLSIGAASGLVSGTPTAAGAYAVVATAIDSSGAGVSVDLTMTIAPQLVFTGSATLPNGDVGLTYANTTMTASGGAAPLAWSTTGMPPGIDIDPITGVIAGTPTTGGSYNVEVYVTDGLGVAIATKYTIVVNPPLQVTTASLPSGQAGIAYPPTTLTTTGGSTPVTWAASGLPSGLGLDPTTGVLSGTPTAQGAFSVKLTATDALGQVATATVPLSIGPPAAALTIAAPATLPSGQVNAAYLTTTVTATGGVPAYTWSATGLPNGLTIDSVSGVISGTPTAAGTFSATVTATDATTATAQKTYSIVVGPAVVVPPGCPSSVTGWRGEYYANQTLAGNPTVCRDDAAINFNWGSGSPAGGIPSDHFSARWTRTENLMAGTYVFTMGSDDGGRLYVDGVLVLDRWFDQGYPSVPPSVSLNLTAGTHTIVMTFYENGGLAQATLTYAQQVTPPACLAPATGWLGEYYSNMTLTGTPTNCRDDATVNFDWGTGAPMSGLQVDQFSVRWTRTMNFSAGDYLFTMGSDDGGRLYIDGTLVLDKWFDQSYPASPPSTLQTLTAGNHTIVMEFYENGGYARATLAYVQQVTPPSCSVPAAGWLGQYYSTVDLSGVPTMCRDDAAINFNWSTGSPAGAMPSDNFSVRWTRTISFSAGTHKFTMGSDDGSRLYIDGTLVFDRWWDQSYPSPPPFVNVTLTAGNHTVVMEFYERGGDARATLTWT